MDAELENQLCILWRSFKRRGAAYAAFNGTGNPESVCACGESIAWGEIRDQRFRVDDNLTPIDDGVYGTARGICQRGHERKMTIRVVSGAKPSGYDVFRATIDDGAEALETARPDDLGIEVERRGEVDRKPTRGYWERAPSGRGTWIPLD